MAAPFVSWVRFAVHVVLVLVLFRGWNNPAMFRAKSLPLQVLRGVFLFGSTFFNFLALNTLQLAETTSIYLLRADGDHRACRPAARRMGRLAALGGDLCRLCRRAGHHPAGLRARLRSAMSTRCAATISLLPLRDHDPPHVGDGNRRKPDLLFGARAGRADAAGRALHGVAAAGRASTGCFCCCSAFSAASATGC